MAERIRPSDEVVQANIKKWGIPQPEQEYVVLIHCSTYNHGKYIKDTLEGFVNQKCTYTFCAIIIDDCSTDNSPDIIREYARRYPKIIKPILLGENHMQHGLLRDPYFENWHKSAKYLAQCEGDDFWTDPMKLQKQVEIMEDTPDVAMIHTDCAILDEDSHSLSHYINRKMTNNNNIDTSDWYNSIISYYRGELVVRTCTSLIRLDVLRSVRDADPFLFDGHLKLGDTQTWVGILLKKNRIKYIDEETSVYRVHKGSASHATSYQKQLQFAISRYEIRLYYSRKYHILKEFPDTEKKYYQYIRIYRLLYAPFYEDIDGNTKDKNILLRLLAKSRLFKRVLLLLLDLKHIVS